MPSPVTHAAAAYWVYRKGCRQLQENRACHCKMLLFWSLLFSFIPDLDVIPGFLTGNMLGYHNQITNSLIVCLSLSLFIGCIAHFVFKKKFVFWSVFSGTCILLHIILDFFTLGRGLMLFWPLTGMRYSPPIPLFYGVKWSEPLFSGKHLITFLSEAMVISLFVCLSLIKKRSKQK